MGNIFTKLSYKLSKWKLRAALLFEDYIDYVQTYQDVLSEGFDVPLDFVSEMCEAFVLFDRDRSGYICSSELGNVLRALGRNPTEKEVKIIEYIVFYMTKTIVRLI